MKYLMLILLIGCGTEIVTQEAVPQNQPEPQGYVDPIQVINRCIFEREVCEKQFAVDVCIENQKKCVGAK